MPLSLHYRIVENNKKTEEGRVRRDNMFPTQFNNLKKIILLANNFFIIIETYLIYGFMTVD